MPAIFEKCKGDGRIMFGAFIFVSGGRSKKVDAVMLLSILNGFIWRMPMEVLPE